MIVLSVMLKAKPGNEKALEEAVMDMMGKVCSENGTIDYAFHRHQTRPGLFFLYEKYKDKNAFDGHMATDYLKQLLKHFDETLEEQPRVERFEQIASIQSMSASERIQDSG